MLPLIRSCVEGTVVCNDTGQGVWAATDLVIGMVLGVVVAAAVVIGLLVLALRSTARTAERHRRQAAERR
ncbi:hypothetical protein [uncultured Amnibacterium sp.]|uniref:hypothetical protein n=1 Tax=uncultured Amnibacterium sp. TaxID=1631851 RepID=UPI0035CBB616